MGDGSCRSHGAITISDKITLLGIITGDFGGSDLNHWINYITP